METIYITIAMKKIFPGRNVNQITQSFTLFPAKTSYKSAYRAIIFETRNKITLKLLKYDAFRKLWHQLTPYIQIMSPRTDLCDTCQQLWNGLQGNARKRLIEEHLVRAKLEGKYYRISRRAFYNKK